MTWDPRHVRIPQDLLRSSHCSVECFVHAVPVPRAWFQAARRALVARTSAPSAGRKGTLPKNVSRTPTSREQNAIAALKLSSNARSGCTLSSDVDGTSLALSDAAIHNACCFRLEESDRDIPDGCLAMGEC